MITFVYVGLRMRKISGNISDNSSCSLKEIRYIRPEDEKTIGEERLLFVSTDNKVPFAVFSVLPFHKSSRIANRYNFLG